MRKFYYIHSFFLLIAVATLMSFAFGKGIKTSKSDTNKLTRVFGNKNDKSYLKNGIHVPLPPLKASTVLIGGSITASNNNNTGKISFGKLEPYKTLSNVQVYPNPITDQINLRYNVAKNSNVTIKIMDVLGNDLITLFSQRVDPGDQKVTFNINNKLSSGFYFVRLIVGNESVIKRISIL